MLFVNVNGEKKIVFRHVKEEKDVVTKAGETVQQAHPTRTECAIIDAATGEALGEASAICSENDRFDYETGRKLALTRALVAAAIPREDRGAVWAAYHDRGV